MGQPRDRIAAKGWASPQAEGKALARCEGHQPEKAGGKKRAV